MKNLLPFIVLTLAVGCAPSYQTRIYDVTVKNDASTPITIWLTKDGPPFEPGWMAPEEIAIESPKSSAKESIGGVVVPEGKSADTGARQGQFEPGTSAVLRVYAGQLSFDQLLSRSQGASGRIDLHLAPGKSSFVVTGSAAAIEVKQPDEGK